MNLKLKFVKNNIITLGLFFSFFIGLIGMVVYFLALNNFVGISFPNHPKSTWFEPFWYLGAIGFAFFCLFTLVNLMLIVPKKFSFISKLPILDKLEPSFSNNKLLACLLSYLFIILTFFMFVCIFDIAYSFNNKTTEFTHYVNEYHLTQANPNHIVEPYIPNSLFLDGKKYNWYAENTMLNQDGSFTAEFISLSNNDISKTNLGKVIRCTNIIQNLNENFYFSIQTISTLGYGNITPATPIGMGLVSVYVLLNLFATIMVFGVVLGQKDD